MPIPPKNPPSSISGIDEANPLPPIPIVQASLGVLQATTAVIGVGTLAGVALSAVNLHQTLKLKKAVERLEVKVENGFINLEQLLKDQGTEIKQLICQVVEEMKFENHRLVLVRAYGLFNQAIQRMRSALQLQDINRDSDLTKSLAAKI